MRYGELPYASLMFYSTELSEETMQTPVEIDFQDMSARPDVHASIEKHVADLEQRYGRVTACRVVLKGPGGHHRTGGLYEVNIRLALPNGREVNVGRTGAGGRAPGRSVIRHQ
jgi:hypothetical protein